MNDPPGSTRPAIPPRAGRPDHRRAAPGSVHAEPLRSGGPGLDFVALASATKEGSTVPEEQLPLGDPGRDWWTMDDIAVHLGVKPRVVRNYRGRGWLPDNDGKFGRTPVWRPATVINYQRPGQGARTDLPHWKAAQQMNTQPSTSSSLDTPRDGETVRVMVLLLFGDQAHLVPADNPAATPRVMPAEPIADQAGLPVGELPGREFSARWRHGDLTDFRLLNDPRL